MKDTHEIIAAIAALTPEQRRRLQRRLRAMGLFATEDLLTDQEKLRNATAIQPDAPAHTAPPAQATPPTATPSQATQATPARQAPTPYVLPEADAPPARMPAPKQAARIEPARASASGKVVLGGPGRAGAPHDVQQMAPLPGNAPEQPIQVVFDGGSRGNPGEGYGSYQVRWPGDPPQTVRLNFGPGYTNNEAEYDTLIAALEALRKRLADMQADASSARVEIRGDSLLVVNQVLGIWKAKDARMEARRDRVRTLLRRFGSYALTHHDRANSVRDLGH